MDQPLNMEQQLYCTHNKPGLASKDVSVWVAGLSTSHD